LLQIRHLRLNRRVEHYYYIEESRGESLSPHLPMPRRRGASAGSTGKDADMRINEFKPMTKKRKSFFPAKGRRFFSPSC
jgi:hypothetical protein